MKKNSSSEKSRSDDTVSELLESLPDAVYLIDLKGVIVNTNSQFTAQFGMQPQECIGANIYDLLINVLQLPELADYHREKCQDVLRTGKRVVFADEKDENLRILVRNKYAEDLLFSSTHPARLSAYNQ